MCARVVDLSNLTDSSKEKGVYLPAGHGWLTKQLDEARLAVGIVAMLLEGPLVEQFEAEGTGEVLWVPLASHGSHALAYDVNITHSK